MNNTQSHIEHRELCQRRDKEFLALYHPTLDALMEQGMDASEAQRAAVAFTIANGHPHYHVSHERAYRCVCHLLNADEKRSSNTRDFSSTQDIGLADTRQRRQMWEEITSRVRGLQRQGMSVPRAIEHVLEHCRASRFFISPATAMTRICTHARTRALR